MRAARLVCTVGTAAGLALTAGCSAPVAPAVDASAPRSIVAGVVTAERVAGGVRLTNGDDSPVAYAVWNPSFLGLFGACTTADASCPRLAPGAPVVVPDADVTGAEPGMPRVVVRWWHVVDGRADAVREIELAL